MVGIFNHRYPAVAALQILLEALAITGVFAVVTQLHSPNLSLQNSAFVATALTFTAIVLAGMAAFGLYRHDEDRIRQATLIRLSLALLCSVFAAHLIVGLFPDGEHYSAVLLESALLAGVAVVPIRSIVGSWIRSNSLARRVMVVGTGSDALAVGQTLERTPGFSLLGYYPSADDDTRSVPHSLVLSAAHTLEDTVQAYRVEEIVVAVREQRGGALPLSHLLSCRLRGIKILDLHAFFERVTGQVPVESLKASWLIYGEGFRQGWLRNTVKRAFDLGASLLLLIPGLPIMLLTAIAIRLESHGPVLFRQERVGLGGRTFKVVKFRSMQVDAERDGRARWASANDPRITRVGRFIRRTRIDELPQIFNVLKGEMSFVGPRPERPFFVAQLTEQIPFYGARHTVKPGITGWAQVRYSYGGSVEDAKRKLQFDLYYVKNHTLFLDLLILLETVRVVLYGEGVR
jgi:sugar transferase (PEP-CTERM system associated)